MKLRFASPELVVDINNVPGLAYHRADPDGTLRIGALTRHVDLERSGLLRSTQPTMAAAAPLIADPIVRNRGTLVGLALPRRPAGRLGLGRALARRLGSGAGPARQAYDPGRGLRDRALRECAGAGRDRHRGRHPACQGRAVRRLPEARAPGRRLRDGRRRRVGGDLRQNGHQGRHRAHRRRRLDDRRHRGGGRTDRRPLTPESIAAAAGLAGGVARPRTDHRGSAEYKRHMVATFVERILTGIGNAHAGDSAERAA